MRFLAIASVRGFESPHLKRIVKFALVDSKPPPILHGAAVKAGDGHYFYQRFYSIPAVFLHNISTVNIIKGNPNNDVAISYPPGEVVKSRGPRNGNRLGGWPYLCLAHGWRFIAGAKSPL